jgi:hypothetical protein
MKELLLLEAVLFLCTRPMEQSIAMKVSLPAKKELLLYKVSYY